MDLEINALDGIEITGAVQLVSSGNQIGLYSGKTDEAVRTEAPFYDYETVLTSVPVGKSKALAPENITIPQPLPGAPLWRLALAGDGVGEIAYTVFGGGWDILSVDTLKDGKQNPGYAYEVEETSNPTFILNSSASPSKQQFVSALFSGYQLGIIGLQEQDGQQVPHVSGIVGTSEAPVSTGRVYGDLSSGLPANVNVVYLTNKNVGPLAPSGAFCGSLFFASYDVNKDKLSTPVALLEGVEFSNFDLAVSGDTFCILAVTGDGSPLLAVFDNAGRISDSPYVPVGSWSNAGNWVASPTIVATPGASVGFSFAFIEMEEKTPSGIYTGTLSSPEVTP